MYMFPFQNKPYMSHIMQYNGSLYNNQKFYQLYHASCLSQYSTTVAPPSAPRKILGSSMTPRSIELSWQQPLTTYGQPYYYYLSCSGYQTTVMYQTQDHITSSHMFLNLRPRTEYSCCVRAVNSAGQGSDTCTTIRTPDAG